MVVFVMAVVLITPLESLQAKRILGLLELHIVAQLRKLQRALIHDESKTLEDFPGLNRDPESCEFVCGASFR